MRCTRSLMALALCPLLGAAAPAAADEPSWTPIGPEGGYIQTLAASPALPNQVFAGVLHPAAPVFRSRDRGRSWEPAAAGLRGLSVEDLAVSANGRTVFAATGIALLRSTDRGATWVPAGPEPPAGWSRVVTHPRRPGLVLALGLRIEWQIFRSADGGATWASDPAWPQDVLALALGPDDLAHAADSRGQVWKSTDAGRTWTRTGPGLPSSDRVAALAVDPRVPRILYAGLAGTRRTLFKSTDGGATWRPSQRGLAVDGKPVQAVRDIVLDAADPSIVYAVVGNAPFRSLDQGRTWARLPSPAGAVVTDLEPAGYGLLAGTPTGVHLSTDRGLTWRPRYAGLTATRVRELAVASRGEDPPRLYALADGRLFHTDDRGQSWRPLHPPDLDDPSFFTSPSLAVAPGDPDTVWLSEDRTVARSTDGGLTWTSFRQPCALLSDLVADPRVPGLLYAHARGLSGCSRTPFAVLRSEDGGATWSQVLAFDFGLLAVDPFDASLYIGQFTTGDLWRYPAGPSDTQLFLGLSATVLTPSPLVPGLLWVVRQSTEVGRGQDGGRTWSFATMGLPAGVPVTGLTPDPADPSTVYAATARHGVFKSTDAGTTWSPVGTWPEGVPLFGGLVVDPADPSILYAGTDDAGVLRFDQEE